MSKTRVLSVNPNTRTLQLATASLLSIGLASFMLFVTNTTVDISTNDIAPAFLWGTILGVASYLVIYFFTVRLFHNLFEDATDTLKPLFQNLSLWHLVLIASAAGFGEELLFRGFLQQFVNGFLPVELAIIIPAALFGLLHFASIRYFLLSAGLGLAFGLGYYLSDNLLLVMVWHAVYDIFALLVISGKINL